MLKKSFLRVEPFKLLHRAFGSSQAAVRITEQKVTVGNVDIFYVKSFLEGAEPEKTVVCLPGALGSRSQTSNPKLKTKLKTKLKKPDFKIIAWDPPGYGKSIPPERHFSKDFLERDADYLKELMDVLDVPSYNILGWSDGGITGMIIAGKYSKNVEKLAIFGSNAYVIEEETKIYDGIRDVSKWSERMRAPLEKIYGAEYFKTKWESWVDTLKIIHKENNGDLCKKFLKHIKAETLILHGEKDPMLAKEHVPYLLQNIKGSKLISWPDGKHNIHLRYADEFNAKVAEFFLK